MKPVIRNGLSALCLIAGLVGNAQAKTVWYILPGAAVGNAVYLAPKAYNKTLYGPVGKPATNEPRWYIAQWNIPHALPAQATSSAAGWQVENQDARVTLSGNGVEFHQTGEGLACGLEYDLFLSPTDPAVYPGYPNGLLYIASPVSRPLRALGSLTLELNAQELAETIVPRCGLVGQIDYGFIVAAVIVSNSAANQVLYYQIMLRDTRPDMLGQGCKPGALPWWWSGPVNYGYNDSIASYGAPCLVPGGAPNSYKLNILKPLLKHIRQAPPGLSKKLNQWKISGVYVGTGLQGSVVMDTRFSGLRLYGQTR